ncbi:AraC family transcriptional regulator [Peribacillus muralis]|uniref:AraC family transcriptional regulator n=1 Tax=Peribacillus muralis TaxID=264697 RepID=UPI001F4E96D4|nr:AraC family transcriptional regulator [Peribacillus muralis]MCK1993586.1 AraC family transcriptional regulator [Peribacillus muralis]MCK2014126.1 AraC family transcriptional regulator [Peribacillus muralis]
MKKSALKENSIHGTASFPLHVYSKVRERDYHVGYHWHEELEFIFVEDGVMEVTINSEMLEVTKGQFIFINSGDLHQITSTGPSIHHAIVFHPDILNFDYPDTSQNSIITPITKGYLRFPSSTQMEELLKESIVDKLMNIIKTNKIPFEISALRIKIMLLEIILALFERKLFGELQTNVKEKQENIKKVMTYIQDNYEKKILLEDLASLLNMNKNYFSKYFHQAIGKTPITYINEYRCEKAAELLKNSDLKVLDISLMVGFDNFSYFIRRFKEHKRYSPIQYRKKYILN